jgi:hypothetical protein
MYLEKLKVAVMASALFVAAQAYGSIDIIDINNISSLDTGAKTVNVGGVLVDANWTVSMLSGGSPPGTLTGSTYVVNNAGFPFGYWVPNDSRSSWLTYSTPTQVDGDMSGGTYRYQLTFTAANDGVIDVRWLSDNSSWLYITGGIYNKTLIGTKPSPLNNNPNDTSPFESWNSPTELNMTAGTQYTVDLDVFNALQSYGNPTGGRVEFTEVSDSPVAVPEPATLITGALLLLPFGASTLRILRRKQVA